MSKTKKNHRKKVAARNDKIRGMRRKAELQKHRRISIAPPSDFEQVLAELKASAVDNVTKEKTINGSFNFNTIRKIKSMETTKKEEAKQVNMSGKASPAPAATVGPEPVYKFTPEAYAAIERFLKSRPLAEAKPLHVAFFRHGQKDPFYKQEAVYRLIEYINACPMEQAEPMMDMLEKGGLQQYMPVADEKGDGKEVPAGEKKETPAEQPAETANQEQK